MKNSRPSQKGNPRTAGPAQQPRIRRIPAKWKPHRKTQEAKPPGTSPNSGKPRGQRERPHPQLKQRRQENHTVPKRPQQHKYAIRERSMPKRPGQHTTTQRRKTGKRQKPSAPHKTKTSAPYLNPTLLEHTPRTLRRPQPKYANMKRSPPRDREDAPLPKEREQGHRPATKRRTPLQPGHRWSPPPGAHLFPSPSAPAGR